MAKITSISEVQRSEDGGFPEVVKFCEDILLKAKAGEIESIAAVLISPNRDILTKSTPTDLRHLEVAAAVYLLLDLAKGTDHA